MQTIESLKQRITELKEKVLRGEEISPEEANDLIRVNHQDADALNVLLAAAHEITLHFNTNEPGLCSLLNAKSYLCGEDCGFCAQSVRFETGVERYPLMEEEDIIAAAKKAEKSGAKNFCLVMSGAAPTDAELNEILPVFQRLTKETKLGIDCSIGFLTQEQVLKLKAAGVRRVNHNLQTSRDYYPQIVSTHSYDVRLNTLKALRDGGIDLCSGGIFGMGESEEDRVKLAFELKEFQPECVPVNLLNPRPGTPLANQPLLHPLEALKAIAVFRFILPKANVKLAGGREGALREYQEKALMGGANGLIVGGYLTTAGNPIQEDFAMLKRAGYERKVAVPGTEV